MDTRTSKNRRETPSEAVRFGILNLLGCAVLLAWLLRPALEKLPAAAGLCASLFLFALTRHLPEGYLGLLGLWRLELPAGLYRAGKHAGVFSEETCDLLQDMMRSNVVDHYGQSQFGDLAVCAKSGTAEVGSGQRPHAWFAGFVDDPAHPRPLWCWWKTAAAARRWPAALRPRSFPPRRLPAIDRWGALFLRFVPFSLKNISFS